MVDRRLFLGIGKSRRAWFARSAINSRFLAQGEFGTAAARGAEQVDAEESAALPGRKAEALAVLFLPWLLVRLVVFFLVILVVILLDVDLVLMVV